MRRPRAGLLWLALLALPALGPTTAAAAEAAPKATEGLKLTGSARVRYETIGNQPRTGLNKGDTLVAVRTGVTAEYDKGSVKVVGTLQDSRAYGANGGSPLSTYDVNAVELTEAYVQAGLRGPLGPDTTATVQAGRFTMLLGSRRLIAGDDFRNTSNSYTGARVDIAAPRAGLTATLVYTLPQVRLPDDIPSLLKNEIAFDRESNDLRLWGGIVTKTGLPFRTAADVTYLGLDERDFPGHPTRNRHLRTADARLIRDPAPGRFDFEFEGGYQYGTIRDSLSPIAVPLDVSASYMHFEVGYSFAGAWRPRVEVDYDYASGDHGAASYGHFDTLLGSRRGDFSVPGLFFAIGRANIISPGVHLELTPNRRTDILLHYEALWLASRTDAFSFTGVRDPTGASGNFAGHDVDARVRYWLAQDRLRLEANAAYLIKGRFLKTAPDAPAGGNSSFLALSLLATF